jgi:hypothetical protein
MSLKEADLEQLVGPAGADSSRDALGKPRQPKKMLFQIHQTIGFRSASWSETGAMAGGDEKRIEGGEGLQNTTDDDVALSGTSRTRARLFLN